MQTAHSSMTKREPNSNELGLKWMREWICIENIHPWKNGALGEKRQTTSMCSTVLWLKRAFRQLNAKMKCYDITVVAFMIVWRNEKNFEWKLILLRQGTLSVTSFKFFVAAKRVISAQLCGANEDNDLFNRYSRHPDKRLRGCRLNRKMHWNNKHSRKSKNRIKTFSIEHI